MYADHQCASRGELSAKFRIQQIRSTSFCNLKIIIFREKIILNVDSGSIWELRRQHRFRNLANRLVLNGSCNLDWLTMYVISDLLL